MSKREQFDVVADSIRNGQFDQAYSQMRAVGVADMPDLLDYFVSELQDSPLALDAAKTYFRHAAMADPVRDDLVAALEELQKQIRAHFKMDVKKHYSLMLADVAASKAVDKARGE